MNTYMIGIHNKYIREKIRAGEKVDADEAPWEDTHYFDIEAESKEQAIRIVRIDHKESRGFVIDSVDIYKK